jgi:hypothetical protein
VPQIEQLLGPQLGVGRREIEELGPEDPLGCTGLVDVDV